MNRREPSSLFTIIKKLVSEFAVAIVFIGGISLIIYFKYYWHPLEFDVDKAMHEIKFEDTLKVDKNFLSAKQKEELDSMQYGVEDDIPSTYQGSAR